MRRRLIFLTGVIAISAFSFLFGSSAAKAAQFTGNEWTRMKNAMKVEEVKAFVKTLRSQGVVVKIDPIYYCKRLDRLYVRHPELKKEEVARTLKTLMIMEYDWDEKGVDKDELAKNWLGEKLYEKNKARRGK